MSTLEGLLRKLAKFKTTCGGAVRLLDDRGDVIVAWPKGCPDPPTTRDEAIEKALVLMREHGLNA